MIPLNSRPDEGDPIDLMLACHVRIRSFSDMAGRLAAVRGASEADVADGARRVHRYFSVALPLHVEDEELSIRPRAEATGDAQATRVLRDLGDQHEAIEQRLGGLLVLWAGLIEEPARLASVAEELARETALLAGQFDAHLRLEEEELFPRLRSLLAPQVLEEIAREMRDRRRA